MSTPNPTVLKDGQQAVRSGDISRLKDILGTGSLSDVQLRSLLRIATHNGNAYIVKILLSCGSPIESGEVVTSLRGRNVEVFQELLNHGWDINTILVPTGETPICYATPNEQLLRWFLEHEADPNAEQHQAGGHHFSPTHQVAMSKTTSKLELLLAHGAKLDPVALFPAMECYPGSGLKIVRFLLENGIDPNGMGTGHEGYGFQAALHKAVVLGRKDYIQILLEYGANPENATCGETPAALARRLNKMDICEMISNWST